MHYEDERLLVQALKKGDKNAFVHLVDKYNRRLFAYALSLTNDHVMAEDILQNVFIRAWEKRKKMQIEKSLSNYLFRTIHNEFINQYKKKQSVLKLEKKYYEKLETVAQAQDDASFDKLIRLINKEVANLPPRCREVFLLSRKEGLTNLEISKHLEISIKTVEAQITKAFLILREKLQGSYRTLLFILISNSDYSKKLLKF